MIYLPIAFLVIIILVLVAKKYGLRIIPDTKNQSLQKEELEKLSLVAKYVNNGVVITDKDGKIEWANDAFLTLMDYTLVELIGKRPIEIFSDKETDRELKEAILKNENKKDIEILNYKKDGTPIWLLINTTHLHNRKGELVKQLEIITDITERKKIENRYTYILQNAGEIIYTCNYVGEFEFINNTAQRILGYEPTELIGKHFTSIIHKDSVNEVQLFYADAVKNKKNNTYLEFKVLSKKQDIVWVAQTVNFIFNEVGKVTGLQAIVRDITFEKNTAFEKQKKYEQQQLFNTVLADLTVTPYETYKSLEAFYKVICQKTAQSLQIERASIWFLNNESLICTSIYPMANNNSPEIILYKKDYPIYFETINKGFAINAADANIHAATKEFSLTYFKALNIKSLLDIPIRRNGELIGVICCEKTNDIKQWTEEEEIFMKTIADIVTINIEADKNKQAEIAIKESENNFRLLNETIDDVFWLFDLTNTKILYISPSSKKILGYPQEDFMVNPDLGIVYVVEEDKHIVINARQKVKKEGFYEIEYRIKKPNESISWIYEKSFGIKDENGNYTKSSGICSDITAKKEIQKTITQLSLVAEKTNNSIIVTDNKEQIIWVNNAFTALTGYAFNEVLGKNPGDLLRGELSSVEAQLEIKNILENKKSGHVEIINYTKKGKPYWTSLYIDPVFNEKGEFIYFISVESEITEQKQREIELKISREKLNEYAEHLEFQNTIKDKLIQSQSLNEITANTLTYLSNRIEDTVYIALLILDDKKQKFSGKKINNGNFETEIINVESIQKFESLQQGNYLIERDLTITQSLSKHEESLVGIGVKSYVLLPLVIDGKLFGSLLVVFNKSNCISNFQISNLSELTNLLSITIEQFVLKDKIFQQNKDLNDSLKYARNIQSSILPFNVKQTIAHDIATLYLPKDHVSGDFYWIEQVGENLIIAVGDCTGHGVPGAFLTLLANSLLQKNVVENKIISPATILTNIDQEIYTILNRNSDRLVRDGMELSICVINNTSRQLTFAGAGLGLFYFINNEPTILRGTPVPIGDYKKEAVAFVETQIDLTGNEIFFMNSDGFQDQLGGENYKRLSKKIFYQYLTEVKNWEAEKQKEYLLIKLKKHQRHYSQTDDITVLGFKIKKQ